MSRQPPRYEQANPHATMLQKIKSQYFCYYHNYNTTTITAITATTTATTIYTITIIVTVITNNCSGNNFLLPLFIVQLKYNFGDKAAVLGRSPSGKAIGGLWIPTRYPHIQTYRPYPLEYFRLPTIVFLQVSYYARLHSTNDWKRLGRCVPQFQC